MPRVRVRRRPPVPPPLLLLLLLPLSLSVVLGGVGSSVAAAAAAETPLTAPTPQRHRRRVKMCPTPSGPHPCDCLHHLPSESTITYYKGDHNHVKFPNGSFVKHTPCKHKRPPRPGPPPRSTSITNRSAGKTQTPCAELSSKGLYHARPFNAEYILDGQTFSSWSVTYTAPGKFPASPPPTSFDGGEFLFWWVGYQDTQDSTTPVLQPVLSYAASGTPNADTVDRVLVEDGPIYYGMSWNCCPNGHKYAASSVAVAPSEQVQGDIDCDATGDCSVVTRNAAGDTSKLSLSDNNVGAPNWDWALMELETYGTKGCESYADGTVEFNSMVLKDGGGKPLDPVDADWNNAPYVQQSETATVEDKATTAFSACCGGALDIKWPTTSMSHDP